MGPHTVHPVEGFPKALKVFIGKACNQIQMLVNVASPANGGHGPLQPLQIRTAVNRCQRLRIGRLNPYLQLHQPRTHFPQKSKLVLLQNIRGNLEVEVSDTIVMCLYVPPNRHGMGMMAVKGSVHKLHLLHSVVEEKLKLPFYDTNVTNPHRLLNGG